MIEGKWLPPRGDISAALLLRREIFLLASDDKDPLSWQAVALWEQSPVATGRIWWEDGAFFIGMVGVLPGLRNRGFGDFIVRLLLLKAQQHHAQKVLLYANADAAPFFQRFGFRPLEEPISDEKVLHMLSGEEILLSNCANIPET